MSNFTEQHNKIANYLQELYQRHRELDDEIKVLYNKFARDGEVNRLKTKKLWFKDEIYRLEKELKELG
jgi:hypothetical protein